MVTTGSAAAGAVETEGAGTKRAEGIRAARWLLGAAVALTCAGMAAATFRGDGSSINAFLFLGLEFSHDLAGAVERWAMGVVLAAGLCGAVWRRWELLAPVALYVLAESVAGWHQGGYPFSELSPLARAPAFVVPVALAIIGGKNGGKEARRRVAGWLVRAAMAGLFLAHGWEALRLHPRFIDLILSTGYNLLGVRWSEGGATLALRVIGMVDVGVAVLVLIRPWKAVLGWMAFWAGLAAASRITAHGPGAYPDLLVRASYVLAPLAVIALVKRASKAE